MLIKRRRAVDQLRSMLTDHSLTIAMETSTFTSLSVPAQLTLYGGAFVLFYLSWRMVKYLRERILLIPLQSATGAHNWQLIGIMTHTAYCGVCESLIVDGFYCDSCGFCSDISCHKKGNANFKCKKLSTSKTEVTCTMKHHWVKGNLPLHSICDFCKEECGDTASLVDYRCCWCQRTVHESCFVEMHDDDCDFGAWRKCIVPPFCIVHKQVWRSGRRKFVVDNVRNFDGEPHWKPLLVIVNKKSGDNDGEKIKKAFRAILNPMQVIDLSETSIESGLEWCRLLAKNQIQVNVRILVAGGDGTVGWVLNTIEKLKLEPKPFVGILPLGTGNDLSKILGWGQSFSCESSLDHTMNKLLKAQPIDLDRWKVQLTPGRSLALGIPLLSKKLFMNNYFSIGADALVALNFHKTRESKIYNYFFNNRFFNKFLYLFFGTKDSWERRCKNLDKKIKLEIDGQNIELPELESILVLNIPSWGGGAEIYGMGSGGQEAPKQSINDKLVEVLGIYSSFHIAQMFIGLSEPIRFGQAKVVKIRLLDRLPMQVDGEPWLQYPTTITVSWNSQVKMLTSRSIKSRSSSKL